MQKQIILVGGMPTAGKSTIAEKLSKHLNLPWFSTDQIGIIMREVATREKHPKLFTWEDHDGMQYLNQFTADEIADRELAKGEAVWFGVRKLIKEDYTWNDGFIIEGDDILPHLVAQDFHDSSNVKAAFIGDHEIEHIRNVVINRNVSRDSAATYPSALHEKEIDWVLNFSGKIKTEAEKHGFAWIEVEKNKQDLAKVLAALGLS